MPGNPNWKPGVSGNPGGRPKKSESQVKFEKACQEYSSEALAILKKKLASAKFDEVKWAVETVLDRGFGRPVISQDVEVNTNDDARTPEQIIADAERIKTLISGASIAIPGQSPEAPGMDA